MFTFAQSGGRVIGGSKVTFCQQHTSNNATSCLQHTHIAKPDLAPELCLWTFINLTFCQAFKSFMQKNSRHLLRNWL